MGDQAEKIILSGEDQLSPVVDKANKALDEHEKKAEKTGGNLVNINDRTTGSVRRLIQSLEKQAEVYGKSGVDRLIAQRDQLLQRYEKEPRAIDAITRSYEKMIATQKKLDSEAKFEGFAEKLKAGIERPLQTAQSAVTGLLSAIGPMGAVMAGGAAALAAVAVASYEAMKALGEYGITVRNAEIRTGFTSKEVAQFGFAAKAAGADISVFERGMRGLTQAVEDDSAAGDKARRWLVQFGVDLRGLREGSVSTATTFQQIAEGIEGMTNPLERNKAMLDLFKRAGIEMIPVMEQLREHLRTAKEYGWGATEAEVDRMLYYRTQVEMVSTAWEEAKRHFLEYLAAGAAAFLPKPGEHPTWGVGPNAPGPFSGLQSAAEAGVKPPPAPGSPASGTTAYLLGLQQYHLTMASNKAAVDQYRSSLGLEGQLKAAEKALGKLPSIEDWSTTEDIDKRRAAEQNVQRLKDAIAAGKKATQEAKDWDRQAAEFTKKGDEAEMSALEKIYYLRDRLLEQGEKIHASESKLAAVRQAANEQAAAASKKIDEAFQKEAAKQMGASIEDRFKLGLIGPGADQLKEWGEGFKADEHIAGIEVDAQRQALRRQAARAGRMADLNPNITEEAAAVQAYQTRVDLAVKLAQIEADRIAKEENAATKRVLAAQALKDLSLELAQAQEQFDEKRAELAQKRLQEVQKQIGDLTRTFEGLFHTLFTKPSDFGKQLGSTLREAALKPVTEGLGSMFAQTMHPLLYGSEGQGGVSGIVHGVFGGGKQDPVTVTSDNTTATVQNSRAIWLLTAVLSEAMGRGVPAAMSTQGTSTIPIVGMASPSGFMGQMLRNTGGLPRFAEGGVTTGASIVGEAGPELVIPLDKLFAAPGPNSPFPYLHGYGPDTEEALGKFSMGLMNIALPASLAGFGGPAGLEVGDVAMSLLLGGLGVATPPRSDGVLQGVLPTGPQRFTPGGLKWAINPISGKIRLAPFERSADITAAFETHADWFERIGLPSSGPEYDRIPRGYAYLNAKGVLQIDDNGLIDGGVALIDPSVSAPPRITYEQFDSVVDRLQRRFPGSGLSASVRQAPDVAYMRDRTYNYDLGTTGDRDFWGQSYEAKRAAGRKGGLATARNRLEEAEARDPHLTRGGKYIGPPPEEDENYERIVREGRARFEAQFPGFISDFEKPYAGAERDLGLDTGAVSSRSASTKAAMANPTRVRYGDELLTMVEAGRRIGKPEGSVRGFLNQFPEKDWTKIDLKQELADRKWSGGIMPSFVEDTTTLTVGWGDEQLTIGQAAKRIGKKSDNSVRMFLERFPEKDWSKIDLEKELRDRNWTGGDMPAYGEHARRANALKVGWGDEQLTIGEAAKRIGKPSDNSVRIFLNKLAEKDWSKIDLEKELRDRNWTGGKMPSYDEGGTVGSTGMAVVHQGEAVVPQADTLKHSIDANTKALQTIPGALMVFVRSIGSRLGQAPQQQRGSVVVVSGPGAGAAEQPMAGIPEVITGSDQMSSTGWGAGVDPYSGQVYQPAPLPPTFGGSTAQSHFSLPGLGSPSQMLHTGAYTAGTGLMSSGVRSGNPLTSAMGGAAMGYGLAPMLGTSGTWGAVTGAGAGIAMAGLSRGGASGTVMSTGGGALIGLQMGGPIGAAIGAAAGLTAGLIREFGVETLADTAHKDIKELYGVDIPKNSGVIKQIVDMAKSQFGGSISMAVRSPSVRQLVMLYAESTGQKMPLSATTPRAGSLVEQGGSLYQAPTFQNGTPYVLQSSIPTIASLPGMGVYPTPSGGPINLSLHVDGQGLAPFMTGQYMTPQFVAEQSMAAQNSSNYRTQQSANLQQPGLIV